MDNVLFSSVFKPDTEKMASLNPENPLGIYMCDITFPAISITCSVSFLWNKYNLLHDFVSKNCWMSDKQSRPWCDTAFYGISSGSALFAQACLSEYI